MLRREHPDFVRPASVFRGYLNYLQSKGLVKLASSVRHPGKPFRDTWWKISERVLLGGRTSVVAIA
jgi:hypothetical protein